MTPEKVKQIAEENGITLDAETLAAFAAQLQQQQDQFEEAEYDALLAQIQQPVSQQAINKARKIAQKRAEELITNMTKTQITSIGESIAEGLLDGKGPKEIARTLDQVVGLDSNRIKSYRKYVEYLEGLDISDAELESRADKYYQKLLNDRKETIARTEAREATAEARQLEAEESGKKYKAWLTVGDERVSDQDQAAEAQGWIPIDEVFANGAQRPPSHPNCRCTLAYRSNPPGKSEQAAVQERAEKTANSKA